MSTKDDRIVDALRDISARLQSLEVQGRNIQGILVEQQEQVSQIRTNQIDDANRTGAQVHKHENDIIEINARLFKLDGQAAKARAPRAGNGSSRR